ncbi:Hypothetical protein A7982_04426 [Minicystis rosea]|nr:Hypothetical protein A7982_04426 [Minicystis rosea]
MRRAAGLRWLLFIVRVVLIACTFQLAGGSHVVVGALYGASAECIDVCASPCKGEPGDHGCPADCPDCSCPHGRLPSLPASLAVVFPEILAWDVPLSSTPYRFGIPPAPPLPELDRPPRA